MPVAALLALVAATQGLGLRLEEAGEITPDEAVALTRALAARIEARCGATVVIDDPLWPGCVGQERCIDAIRARTGDGDVVLLRVFGGLTKARVITERFAAGADGATRAELDVPRDAGGWAEPLTELAGRLCPTVQVSHGTGTLTIDVAAPVAPEGPRVLPWVLGGTGVALAVVGIAFGASSASARADAADPTLSDAAFDALADRTQAHAITADVLFVAAGVSAVTGLVLALIE
ncbi:hypothetical protein L6R52_34750 [Myxococcota bacterium]|nr:hypothetical protein [Myxococcota bacterium]